MNKRTKKMLPSFEPVQSNPISLSDSTVARAGTSQTDAACPHRLLFNADVLSVRPDKPVTNTGVHFQYKLRV